MYTILLITLAVMHTNGWTIQADLDARAGYDDDPEDLPNECPECGNPCGEYCEPCSQAAADFHERAYGWDG